MLASSPHFWTYVAIVAVALIIGYALLGPTRGHRYRPLKTRTDAAFQREHDNDDEGPDGPH